VHFELKSLCLKRTKITDIGILEIREGYPHLQSIDLSYLSYCKQVSDVGISKIAEGCPRLQSLFLFGCNEVCSLRKLHLIQWKHRGKAANYQQRSAWNKNCIVVKLLQYKIHLSFDKRNELRLRETTTVALFIWL